MGSNTEVSQEELILVLFVNECVLLISVWFETNKQVGDFFLFRITVLLFMILVEKKTKILNYGKQSLYLMVCLSILKSRTVWTVIQESQSNSSILASCSNVQDAVRSGLVSTLYLKGLSTQYLSLYPYMHLRFDTGWHLIKVLKFCPVFSKFLVRLWLKFKMYVSSFMYF